MLDTLTYQTNAVSNTTVTWSPRASISASKSATGCVCASAGHTRIVASRFHPRHLSWFERVVLRRHVRYDPALDREARVGELRDLYWVVKGVERGDARRGVGVRVRVGAVGTPAGSLVSDKVSRNSDAEAASEETVV